MLHLHRADRADHLADALGELLAQPLGDPFAPELVAVPTRGMERWLAQRLAARLGASPGRSDGICAGIDFPPPRRLLGDALALATGVDPQKDPWIPERLTWPLLEVVEAHADEPWLAPLARAIGHGHPDGDDAEREAGERRRSQRLTVVSRIAALLHRYGRYRPGLIEAWAAGRDEDGTGQPMPERLRWQAELWRALRARVGEPSPAERLAPAIERLTNEPDLVAIPERLAAFGLTRMAAADVVLLNALAQERDIHLYLLHPSPALWDALRSTDPPRRRADDRSARTVHHPLLRSWGRDARELQLTLGDPPQTTVHGAARAQGTLLERLQADIVADRAPDGTHALDPGDDSVSVHACHGRARQVEVLRDAVLGALEADPSLEPRDVIVMCPDIESYAPLIQATFGAAIEGDTEDEDLRVRLADRSPRQVNGVLAALAALLELAGGRLTASELLDFAGREPVRRRFRLRDDDLTLIAGWVRDTGIRWGLDAHHRTPFRVPLREGTWAAGLDRVLLGVTLAEAGSRRLDGVLPLDGVDDIDMAGRLAELVSRLRSAVDALTPAQTLAEWAAALDSAAHTLTATSPRDAWQSAELRRLLDDLLATTDGTGNSAGGRAQISRTEFRALLGERLAGRPTRANFRTGHLTVCTMYPMRSVPHRVICLLGLDDGAFPRRPPGDGDDVLLADPLLGERDPRSEDRQLLLDALLAARERLIVTFAGADERTNLFKPPAVPVGELLDAIDATAHTQGDRPAHEAVLRRHPLQPFDRRNFAPERPFSFDRTAYAGARACLGPRSDPPAFLPAPLPPAGEDVIALEDLISFVVTPARAFLLARLGVRLSEPRDEIDDALPVELDALEEWGVGQRLLDALLTGEDTTEAYRAEIARGLLPPGQLALPLVQRQLQTANAIATVARAEAGSAPPAPLPVHVPLPDGRLLSGGIAAVRGAVLLQPTFSRVQAKQRLTAWVRLLAQTATDPEPPFTALTVGRGRGEQIKIARIPPLAEDPAGRARAAAAELARLIDLYDRGMREPLPLPCRTACAWAEAVRLGDDPEQRAGDEWRSSWLKDGSRWLKEDADQEEQLIYGGRTFDELLAEAPAPGESGPGWEETETTRLGRLARRLWDPLLDREQVG